MNLGNDCTSYDDRISVLRRRFLEKLPPRMERARELVSAASVVPDPREEESAQRELHRLVHEVCGSSGMVGLPGIEAEARAALMIIEVADRESAALSADQQDSVLSAVTRISQLAAVDGDQS